MMVVKVFLKIMLIYFLAISVIAIVDKSILVDVLRSCIEILEHS